MNTIRDLFSRLGMVLVLAGIGALGFLAFGYFFIYPKLDIRDETGKQSAPMLEPTAVLRGNDLQEFLQNFSPLLDTQQSEQLRLQTGVRNLVIISSDGEVKYTQKTVEFDSGSAWSANIPLEITGVGVEGSRVEFAYQHIKRYVLNVTQPFIFAGNLNRVYVIDAEREIWSAPLSELMVVAADNSVHPEIAANPLLSISYGN